MPKQSKETKKKFTKIPLSLFVLAIYSWEWDVHWSVINTLSDNPPGITHFSFVSGCINCWWLFFLARSGSLFPVLPLSAGTQSGLNLYRPCAYCYGLWEFMCSPVLLCLEDTVFLKLSITSWLLQSFCALFCLASWFLWIGVWRPI